jgi:uncharacterized protein
VTARLRFSAVLLLALVWGAPVLGAAGFTVPPTPDHHVVDTASALSSDTRGSIENELQAYEKATGHQIVVWIGQTTGDVPLETFTTETAHQWRIGRRGHDDGAILFVFMKDHKLRVEVGYGLESSLTDADSSRIINDVIRPRMRSNDVDGAVSSGIAAMIKTITPSYSGVTPPPASSESESGSSVGGGIAVAIFAIFGVFMAFVAFLIIMQVLGSIRYGYLVLREGTTKAKADMKHWWFWGSSGFALGSSSGGGGFSSGGFDSGFSAGGGDFGGGGASGGW